MNERMRDALLAFAVAAIELSESMAPPDPAWLGAEPEQTLLHRILGIAAATYGVRIASLTGPQRHKPLVYQRFALLFELRNRLRLSYPMLGRIFGKDHTTIMHAVRVVAEWDDGMCAVFLHPLQRALTLAEVTPDV